MLTRRCCSSTARWSALDARQAGPAGGSIKHQSRSYETLTTAEIFSTSNPDHRGGPSAGTLQPADLARRNRLKSSSSQQLATYIEPESDDALRRAERRSPAAVFGARRMPRIAIPSELENKLERLVGQQDMALTKRCFQLFLPAPDAKSRDPQALPPPKKSASTNLVPRDVAKQKATSKTGRVLDLTLQPLKLMPRQTTPELVLAHAAAELPSQYAVMRTIMRELQSRNGWDAPGAEGRIQIVDFAAGYGATAWAAAATLPSPREKRNALVLIEPSPLVSDLSRELLKVDTPGPLARWPTLHFRSLHKYQTATGAPRLRSEKSVGVLAFALSALARPQDRRRKLKELWYSGVESVVVVEMGHRDGWTAVEEAREFLLGIGREERAEAAKQAGEWVPPTPSPTEEQAPKPAAADEPAAAEPALVVPRTRGRRRPGERARPSTMAAAEKESASAAEPRLEGGLSVDHGQPDVAHKRKPEKFVFNGVEFEEVDEAIDGADANQSKEAVEWTADGKELVRDGRILGNWVVAPCPHDEKCPLASTPTPCAFSQLLETPVVTRLTKNVKQDQSRLNFSYFILRRGTRPEISEEDRGEGREGEVAREVRLAQAERDGAVAVLGEDGIFDVPDKPAGVGGDAAELPPVDYSKLRREISEWGRVLKAPIHRKGHSEVDLCTADGTIKRTTFSKKLGKQVWYDTAQIEEGDAFPHKSKTAVVRERGINHLVPAHKTNKIAVRGGVVSGIDKLSYVEWKEASEMLGAMGVPVPDYDSGKRPKNKRWIVEYSDEIEAREGWEAAHKPERRIDPLAKEKLIEGILAGEEDFESVSFDTNLRQTRPVANKSGDNAASYGLLEFEPTPLVDAREVVPPTASRASDVESAPTGHASSPASWAANPGMADLLGDIVAEQAGLSNSSGGLELAASTKVSLAGLGEGWMEEFEADISPADRRAAARDRQRTFAQMGIPVPDLGRPRTLKDDWDLLEKWDGVADRPVPPKRHAFWNRRDWRPRKKPPQ